MDIFARRIIGFGVAREYVDRLFFWNSVDMTRQLEAFRDYYRKLRVRRSLGGTTPAQRPGAASPRPAALNTYAWRQHCHGLFQTQVAA